MTERHHVRRAHALTRAVRKALSDLSEQGDALSPSSRREASKNV